MAAFTVEEQRAYIKIEVYKGSAGIEIFNTLQYVCGEEAVLRASVFRWVTLFKEGRMEVVNKLSPGRPSEATNEENIAKVREILEQDIRMTCTELAQEARIS